ncbi:MAG: TolC family outer membrane protein [Hyphomicrobiales bacterium]
MLYVGFKMSRFHALAFLLTSLSWVSYVGPTHALTLKEAIGIALESNPTILSAGENKEAVEFELRQARGLYLPTIDLEGSTGFQRLNTPGRRSLGSSLGQAGDTLLPNDVNLVVRQTIFDGGDRRSQVERQAARVDGASFRVAERSEAIALSVAQQYIEILLQQQIIEASRQNISILNRILGDINRAVAGGSGTRADTTQGRERLLAARANLKQAQQGHVEARARFKQLVGVHFSSPARLGSIRRFIPASLSEAVRRAKKQNSRISAVAADIDSADAEVNGTRSVFLPRIEAEVRGAFGDDTGGSEGFTRDLQGRLVARWNLYRGGRDVARRQELIRRADEQRTNLLSAHREVEESVRLAWNSREKQTELHAVRRKQAAANAQIVSSYRSQFQVGERSLLDLLNAQNTRFNSEILTKTTKYASIYGGFQVLGAMGGLVDALSLSPIGQSEAYARKEFNVEPTQSKHTFKKLPSRQIAGDAIDLLAPLLKKSN